VIVETSSSIRSAAGSVIDSTERTSTSAASPLPPRYANCPPRSSIHVLNGVGRSNSTVTFESAT